MDYVIQHHGVKGMKWGVRRYTRKDGTLTKAGKKRYARQLADEKAAELERRADKEFKRSSAYRYSQKKGANPDDSPYDRHARKADELRAQANKLSKNYVRTQARGSALVSSFSLAPLAVVVANKAVRAHGKKKVAALLGTGFATVALTTIMGAKQARQEQREAMRKHGIIDIEEQNHQIKPPRHAKDESGAIHQTKPSRYSIDESGAVHQIKPRKNARVD